MRKGLNKVIRRGSSVPLIHEELVAKHNEEGVDREEYPYYFMLRDSSMVSDDVADNFEQILANFWYYG